MSIRRGALGKKGSSGMSIRAGNCGGLFSFDSGYIRGANAA